MHAAHSKQTFVEIRFFLRVWLGEDALVALPGGARFVSVNARDDKYLIRYLLGYLRQTVHVIKYGILIIRGARTDDNKEFVRFPGKYPANLYIPFPLCSCGIVR